MSTVQSIDSVDSLVPNGTFVEGLAYWDFYPNIATPFASNVARHEENYADGQASVPVGTPKYTMRANYTAACWLNRDDLFEYPVRRLISNVIAFPISSTALKIVQSSGSFAVESIDHGTPYEATLNNGQIDFELDPSTPMPSGTKLVWSPPTGSGTTVEVVSEVTVAGSQFRSFDIVYAGGTTAPPGTDLIGTINFVVRKEPDKGSTVVLNATDSEHSGYYTVDRVSDTFLKIVPQSGSLVLKAKTGDVQGVLYNRDPNVSPDFITLRVFGDLTTYGVSVGDYFTTSAPARSYGKILSISPDSSGSGVQRIVVNNDALSQPLPYTATGQFVAISNWAVSAQVNCSAEISIPAVRYSLTLAFTARGWPGWNVSLCFVKEEGQSTGETHLVSGLQIAEIPATFVREFDATDPVSAWKRRVYKIQMDAAVPFPGLPQLKFTKIGTGQLVVGHLAMFKGDFTGLLPVDDPQTQLDYDTLEYNTAPDGGIIPKGTVVPFIGGTQCPPGWKPVIGEPSDGDTPSTIDLDIPSTLFSVMDVKYNYGTNVTTVKMRTGQGQDFFSVDGYSYYPWAAHKVLMPVDMRGAPSAPVVKYQIKVFGRRVTLFRSRLPEPDPRPQRYAKIEIGLLESKIIPGQFLQLTPDSRVAASVLDSSFFPIIGSVRVTGGFIGEELDHDTKTYPTSYQTLLNSFNIMAAAPTLFGIIMWVRIIQQIIKMVDRERLYDPTQHGEPLPPVRAVPDEEAGEQAEIDLLGDWREALARCKSNPTHAKVRVTRTGYVKSSTRDSGKSLNGAPEHNHRMKPSPDLDIITGVAAEMINSTPDQGDRPPVLVGHGHDYLGAGGYSRPEGRGVILCIKL